MKPCFIVPIYNHHDTIENTVEGLAIHDLPILVVDDGSNQQTRAVLQRLEMSQPLVRLLTLDENRGKGAAVMTAMNAAHEAGFTHALQVDADCQHDLADVPPLLARAERAPQALISGLPVYDDSIPVSRKLGRYITHFWVWVETLSFQIRDSMCGFRVYPLAPCVRLIENVRIGTRMDFDTEIMVRLFWQGVEVEFQPTKVSYPPDGVSHFRAFSDNVRISWLHTRLFFGMLVRLPAWVWAARTGGK